MKRHTLFCAVALAAALGFFLGCSKGKNGGTEGEGDSKVLVLYVAGDSIFNKTIYDAFAEEHGIEIKTAHDTETSRGVALRKKIVQEKDDPRADVYWNNELVNTILLKKEGCLAQYKSSSAQDIPEPWFDPEGYWTAFGARARVFIVNTEKVPEGEEPDTYEDFLDPKWSGKCGISEPLGGTTATHAAALFELWGEEKAKKFYTAMKDNGVVICKGNGQVMRQVAAGELHWGWTDTNDCKVALDEGKPVKVVYPDQDGRGTLLIPHSVALIKDAPHPELGKKFIDFLLSKETEKKLAFGKSVQIPVRSDVETPDLKQYVMDISKIKNFNDRIDWNKVADRLPETIQWLNEHFVD